MKLISTLMAAHMLTFLLIHMFTVIQIHFLIHTFSHTHTHTRAQLLHQGRTWIFLHTLLERVDHRYFNGQHLACEVMTGICEVLTESRLSIMYKMIREILSMPRADSGYPYNFMINSRVFKDDEFESDAKTNSRHRVCILLVGSPLLAWRVHAQSPPLAHCVNTCTHARVLLLYLYLLVNSYTQWYSYIYLHSNSNSHSN